MLNAVSMIQTSQFLIHYEELITPLNLFGWVGLQYLGSIVRLGLEGCYNIVNVICVSEITRFLHLQTRCLQGQHVLAIRVCAIYKAQLR